MLTSLLSATDETSFEAGIKVQIHSQDEPPLIDQLGFGVAPGFQTFVSCQEQRVGTGQVWDVPPSLHCRSRVSSLCPCPHAGWREDPVLGNSATRVSVPCHTEGGSLLTPAFFPLPAHLPATSLG